jgi:hypothetical protein
MIMTCLPKAMVVGRIMKAAAAPVGTPWLWTLAYGYHEDRMPTHTATGRHGPPWQRSQRAGEGNSRSFPNSPSRGVASQPIKPLQSLAKGFWRDG